MEANLPAKYLGTPLDGILQEEAAANAHSGRPFSQNQHPADGSLDNATPDVELGEVDLDNTTPDLELGEVDLGNTTPGVELGEDPEVEKKRPASAGVKVGIPKCRGSISFETERILVYKAAITTHCLRPANTRRKSRTRPSSAWIQSLPCFWPQLRLLWSR
jgi:hypothetical protein